MIERTWRERRVAAGAHHLNIIEQGEGPVVLMIHGFPGLAWSWRHQMAPLAQAGFRAVAIDSLGYGASDRPAEADHYTAARMQDLLTALLDALGAESAFVIGQDFGAQYAWNLAVRSPRRVAGLVATIPYDYDLAGRAMLGGAPRLGPDDPVPPISASPDRLPSERFAAMGREHFVHLDYFQQVGPAEAELAGGALPFLHRLFHALSSEGDLWSWKTVESAGHGYLDVLPDAPPLPWPWLSEEEFAVFLRGYEHPDPALRFIGGLNSYRTADANWIDGLRWADDDVSTPTLFVHGAADPSFGFFPEWESRLPGRVPGLRGMEAIAGAGHFVQQERPDAFNAAVLPFFTGLRDAA